MKSLVNLTTPLLAIAVLMLGLTPKARADHDMIRAVHRSFDLQRAELERAYRADRDSFRFDFERSRDVLNAEYDRVLHSHCVDRGIQLREIRSRVACLTRDYNIALRELAGDYALRRKMLNNQRDLALAEARYDDTAYAIALPHPGSCGADCPICHPAVHARGPAIRQDRGRGGGYGNRVGRPGDHGEFDHPGDGSRVVFRRTTSADVDWASLILGLLANRAN